MATIPCIKARNEMQVHAKYVTQLYVFEWQKLIIMKVVKKSSRMSKMIQFNFVIFGLKYLTKRKPRARFK